MRGRHRAIGALGALVLGLGVTLGVAAPATAADVPTVVLSDTTVHDDGSLDVTVTGSGFSGAVAGNGIYVAVGPKVGDDWYLNASAFQATKWVSASATGETASRAVLAADGTFTVHFTGLRSTFVGGGVTYDAATTPFSVLTLAAHGSPDRSFDTSTPLTFPAPEPEPVTPAVSVSDTTLTSGQTTTLTVTGTGFDPALATGTRPPFAGKQSGVYIAFGRYADTWRPSAGAPSSARVNASGANGSGVGVIWAVPAASFAGSGQDPTSASYTELRTDGSFTATVTVNSEWLASAAGSYGIYTYAGGGATVAAYETATALTFTAPAPVPTVTVSDTSLTSGETTTLTVTGTGFDPALATGTRPPFAGKSSGVYIAFGRYADTWRPSAGAPSTARVNASGANGSGVGVIWAVPAVSFAGSGQDPTSASYTELRTDGSFTATVTVNSEWLASAAGNYGIYTYAGGGATVAAYETATALTFTAPEPQPVVPAVQVAERTVAADGSLSLTLVGSGFAGARTGAGIYVAVGPKIGSDWYLQAARFQATKWVSASATAETASMAPLAADGTFTVHLTGLRPSFVGGGVTYDASTTPFSVLTMAAHGSADRSFDTVTPVSFAGTSMPGTGTPTPTTPPATGPTTGTATVDGLAPGGTVQPGATLTLSAGGFGAGEQGARLELHSTPVVLATGLQADATGTVTVTFTVPTNTPAGAHTLYLIGAQHTATFAVVVAAAPECVARSVSGASLTWGVRESFRTYVTGPIANGSITASGVSGSGPWTWGGGRGQFNTAKSLGGAAFGGSVHFTGHSGTLDLTIASPRVQVDGPSSGTLFATVTGADGASSRVAIASLRLSAGSATSSADQVRWTGVPATLTAAGAAAFAGFYTAGEALDPVSFTLPLGSAVECDPSTGLASTGSEVAPIAAGAGLLVVLGGLLALVARRRRPLLQG